MSKKARKNDPEIIEEGDNFERTENDMQFETNLIDDVSAGTGAKKKKKKKKKKKVEEEIIDNNEMDEQ